MAQKTRKTVAADSDRNPDPITEAPGAHPVGVGIGAAAGGAATGALAGAVGGPVGAVVGAVAGAVIGGYAGKAAAEVIDPTVEDAYWRDEYPNRPYFDKGLPYDEYKPAYQYGWEARQRNRDQQFQDVEPQLEKGWAQARANSGLGWDRARSAARDAWDRTERALPGDIDNDGR